MRRILCRFGWHDWKITAYSSRSLWLPYYSLAGCRATCRRCGEEWGDIPAHYVLSKPP